MTDDNALVPVTQEPPTPMALMQHAIDKGASPDSLQQLYALHKQVQADEAAITFAERLSAFQAECPRIHKAREVNLGGGGYSFAGFDDIMREIQPLLTRHGLTPSFSADLSVDGQVTIVCSVRCGIHEHKSSVTLPMPAGVKVNDTQKAGMAVAYGKRYALCMALNIVVTDEDSDAGGMGETVTEEQAIQLKEMVEATKSDMAKFLAFAGAGTGVCPANVDEIPASRFQECMDKLKEKMKKNGANQ